MPKLKHTLIYNLVNIKGATMKILNIVTNLFNKYISTLFSSHEDMVNYIFTNDSLPAPLDDNDEHMYINMFGTPPSQTKKE